PRTIAPPHFAPHSRSNRLALAPALALARISWLTIALRLALALAQISWLTIALRLALALALFAWHTVSLRLALALALARIGRRGSRPLHFGAAALLQLGGQQAHG